VRFARTKNSCEISGRSKTEFFNRIGQDLSHALLLLDLNFCRPLKNYPHPHCNRSLQYLRLCIRFRARNVCGHFFPIATIIVADLRNKVGFLVLRRNQHISGHRQCPDQLPYRKMWRKPGH